MPRQNLYVSGDDESVWDTARRKANERDTSLSAYVTEALRWYMEESPKIEAERMNVIATHARQIVRVAMKESVA